MGKNIKYFLFYLLKRTKEEYFRWKRWIF